jgi:hypothetical protein
VACADDWPTKPATARANRRVRTRFHMRVHPTPVGRPCQATDGLASGARNAMLRISARPPAVRTRDSTPAPV